MKVFPTCLFAPDGQEADLDRRIISGGTALSGNEDVVATDGGGRVFYEIADPYLDEPATALAWRALSAYLDGGVRPIIVPFCDGRHQPVGALIPTPHSDGTTFSDESEYEPTLIGEAVGAADLRATTMSIRINALPRPLLGGEWFSIDHPSMRWRAYRIAEVLSVAGSIATVSFRPPLREAVSNGDEIDFGNPRCTMRLEGAMRSPMQMGFASGGPVRFVEDFTGAYS